MNLLMAVLLLIFYAKRRVVAHPANLSGVLYTKEAGDFWWTPVQ